MIVKRYFNDALRNPLFFYVRFLLLFMFALLGASLYYDLGYNYTDTYSKAGYFYYWINQQNYVNICCAIQDISRERPVINKEIKSKTYTVTSYYFAKAFIEFSMAVIIGFIFCVTTYFWVNLNNDFSHFAIFCTAMTMVAFYTGAIALAVGSCVHNDRIALVVVIGINTGIYILGGYIVNFQTIYPWLRWLQYICPSRYVGEILLRNEFDGNTKYAFNPAETFGLDIGVEKWWTVIIVMVLSLRIMSYVVMKISM